MHLEIHYELGKPPIIYTDNEKPLKEFIGRASSFFLGLNDPYPNDSPKQFIIFMDDHKKYLEIWTDRNVSYGYLYGVIMITFQNIYNLSIFRK